jgi:small conductance mechanosensitive channel
MPGVFTHFAISGNLLDQIDVDMNKLLQQLNVGTDTLLAIFKNIALYIILRVVLRRIVSRVIVPLMTHTPGISDAAHSARLRTLAGLLNSILSYVLSFVFAVMLLRAVHLDPIPLLTTASVAGLAVGFGAQKLVKDVISGFFILLENQYAIGDYVTIGAITGTVEEVGMRTTRIRDDLGRLYILSNGDISQVCNQSRGPVEAFIEIGVAPDTDVAKATEIVNAAGQEIVEERKDLGFAEAPLVQGISAMDAAKLTLRIACRTITPARLLDAQLALRGHMRARLTEAGIGLA